MELRNKSYKSLASRAKQSITFSIKPCLSSLIFFARRAHHMETDKRSSGMVAKY